MDRNIVVRELTELDAEDIAVLDEISDFYVEPWADTGCAYGIFERNNLIGYFTLGYADDCGDVIEDHPMHTIDSLIISNVFIKHECRGEGLGLKAITEVIDKIDESIYLTVLDDEIMDYYRKIGFVDIGDCSMYRKHKEKKYKTA